MVTVACLILGDEEAANNTVKLKWMVSKEQNAIAQADLLAKIDELRDQIAALRTEIYDLPTQNLRRD